MAITNEYELNQIKKRYSANEFIPGRILYSKQIEDLFIVPCINNEFLVIEKITVEG